MQKLGTGVLKWSPGGKRLGVRIGFVGLFDSVEADSATSIMGAPEGSYGRLVAVVEETRERRFDADRFLFSPPEPLEIGDEIVLGTGTFLSGDDGYFGLVPSDGREGWWLDIPGLYRVDEQTVDLFFDEVSE